MIKKSIAFLLLLFLTDPAVASEPIRIGLTLGLTGKYSVMSKEQMKGFRLWEKQVNSRGGLLGRDVKIIIYDDKSDPQTAKSLYEQLILKDKVDLLFGPYSSEITEAILPLTEKYGYPVIASGASSDSLFQKGYRYVFGVYAPASRYSVGFFEMLVREGLKDIAIVHADDLFSKEFADGTKKWIERFGLNMVLSEGFKKGAENLDGFARKVKASKAQVLIVCGYLDEAVNMRLSLKRIGWYPKAYFATIGPTTQAFHDRLGKDAEYAFSASIWDSNATFPGSKKFYGTFVKTYGKMLSSHAAVAYAGGQILEVAIKRAESIDRERIRDKLSKMDEMTVIGRYNVDRTGMQIKNFSFIIQWQYGKKELVWPEELMTAKPIFK